LRSCRPLQCAHRRSLSSCRLRFRRTPPAQPDIRLLQQAQKGDQEAFCTIVRLYQTTVFNYVLRVLGGDRALAEDLTQEVFLRVYQGLPGFNLRCRFTTWLFQVAKHRVLDELRARERRGRPPIDIDSMPIALAAYDPDVQMEEMDAVFRAIASLNPDLRMALLLRDIAGLSYNEIAETLEITLATTKWRIFKARELTAERLIAEGVLRSPEPVRASAA
jgi:RNA polymerase sigma-70 factor (ECF subfamily)